ncbi:MAG: TauD/TfdA family dioxygenase [Acidimicrobiales bacterium]|nr:TauD/TfdA family dioxygenase [Acidimicrobiales bacterium]
MKITPVASTIGAEISGVDLTRLTDAELVDIQCALLAHHVVFFRGQQLEDDSHMEFVRRWGDPVPHPVHAFFGAEQTVGVVFNDEEHPPADGEGWHTDHSWADYVPDAAVLRAIDVPAVGGDTLWTDVGSAYQRLSPAMQEFLLGLSAHHSPGPRFDLEMRARMPDEMADQIVEAFPGRDHPVVVAHPVTGQPGLFVSPSYTTRINGLSGAESDVLLRFLCDHIARADFVVRWRWEAGSVAIWDEHATLHRGPNDFGTQRRVLHRLTVGATTPSAA